MVAKDGLPAVIVNPSTPIGPRDVRPTPTGRITARSRAGRMPAFVDTGLEPRPCRRRRRGPSAGVRQGPHRRALYSGRRGLTLAGMLAAIASIAGRKPPTVELPRGAALPAGLCGRSACPLTGKEPFLTVDGLKMAKYRMFFSQRKAEPSWATAARPSTEALRRRHGLVPPSRHARMTAVDGHRRSSRWRSGST